MNDHALTPNQSISLPSSPLTIFIFCKENIKNNMKLLFLFSSQNFSPKAIRWGRAKEESTVCGGGGEAAGKRHMEGIHVSKENINAKGQVTAPGFRLHRICSITITHVTKKTLHFQ